MLCHNWHAAASVRSGQFPSPPQPPLLFFSAPQKQRPPPPPMDSHQGPSRGRAIASSMPIVGEASIAIPPSQANRFSTTNPFVRFRPIENIPPASRPPQQQAISSSQHAQQHQKSFSSMQRSIQLPGSLFNGSPHDAQMIGMTNNAPESSNVELGLGLQQPSSHTAFPQHDYAALVADAPDITNFLDSFPGHLQGMKLVRDPPDLDTWRNILFHVDEMITLSEEQYAVSQARLDLDLTANKHNSIDFKYIFHTSTMSIPIALLSDTSASHLLLTIGIAG